MEIELARALRAFGYSVTGRRAAMLRLTTLEHGQHHLTIPRHDPLKSGTLSAILAEVASHFDLVRDDPLKQLVPRR